MAELISRRSLLICGMVAGPLLLVTLLIDGATRPGYDQWRHGVSQLTLGERGWLARMAFVMCGLLMLGYTVGVRHVMRDGRGAVWGPRPIGAAAGGLVIAGVFPTDPALGYPPGAAEEVSVAGGIHWLGGTLLFAGLIGASFVWASRFARHDRQRWANYSMVTGVLVTVCALAAGIVYRLMQKGVIATGPAGLLELLSFVFGFTWITLVALALTRTGSGQADSSSGVINT